MKRPKWCPHPKECKFIRTTQDALCCGKMKKAQDHGVYKNINTHYLCINAELCDKPKMIITDLQVYEGDIWWMIDFLKTMRKGMKL